VVDSHRGSAKQGDARQKWRTVTSDKHRYGARTVFDPTSRRYVGWGVEWGVGRAQRLRVTLRDGERNGRKSIS